LRYRGQSITHRSACALPLSTPLLPSPEGDTFLPVCVSHRKTAKRFMQHIKPRGVQCRAIVPNGSTRRAAEASYGCLALARRATLLCRYASANRGCCNKPPIKGGRAKQRVLSLILQNWSIYTRSFLPCSSTWRTSRLCGVFGKLSAKNPATVPRRLGVVGGDLPNPVAYAHRQRSIALWAKTKQPQAERLSSSQA
jgi:hypothetical protein